MEAFPPELMLYVFERMLDAQIVNPGHIAQ